MQTGGTTLRLMCRGDMFDWPKLGRVWGLMDEMDNGSASCLTPLNRGANMAARWEVRMGKYHKMWELVEEEREPKPRQYSDPWKCMDWMEMEKAPDQSILRARKAENWMDEKTMKGWKTLTGSIVLALGGALYAVGETASSMLPMAGWPVYAKLAGILLTTFGGGLGVVGVGHKVVKAVESRGTNGPNIIKEKMK
jgi:hypothetical protein